MIILSEADFPKLYFQPKIRIDKCAFRIKLIDDFFLDGTKNVPGTRPVATVVEEKRYASVEMLDFAKVIFNK